MEIWNPIVGFDGYEINAFGEVKGKRGKLLKQYKKNGLLSVTLKGHGSSDSYFVNKLVATTFLSNPNGYENIAYKDGNSSNNFAGNLMWVE